MNGNTEFKKTLHKRIHALIGLLLTIAVSSCGVVAFSHFDADKVEQRKNRFTQSLLASRALAPVYPDMALANSNHSFTMPETQMIFQITPEIITRLGDFLTPLATSLPRPLEFTYVAVMVVPKELRAEWMQPIDQSLFILDGKQGLLYYSFGKNSLYSFKDDSLSTVKGIAVNSHGLIATRNADDSVSLCLQFNGAVISKISDCSPITAVRVSHLTSSGDDEFIAISLDEDVLRIKTDKSIAAIEVSDSNFDRVRSVWADSSMLVITDKAGERVTVYNRTTGTVLKQVDAFELDFGQEPMPSIGLVALVPISGGGYLGVSDLHNVMILFDTNLDVQASRQFPEFPYPLEHMHSPTGLYTNIEGGIVVLTSKSAVNAYAVRETANYDFGYLIPASLQPLFTQSNLDAVLENLKSNPQADVLDMPEIKAYIAAAREAL